MEQKIISSSFPLDVRLQCAHFHLMLDYSVQVDLPVGSNLKCADDPSADLPVVFLLLLCFLQMIRLNQLLATGTLLDFWSREELIVLKDRSHLTLCCNKLDCRVACTVFQTSFSESKTVLLRQLLS